MDYDTSDERRPLFWLGGHPVHAALAIVLCYCVTMVATTAFMALRVTLPFDWLAFDSGAVWRGQAWRVLTYGLVNPPSLWFVIDMAMLFWFGRELERFFGRRVFLQFYASLYLLTPLVFLLIGRWWPMTLTGQTGSFALFIAFATLQPDAPIFFNLLAKWVAAALVGIYTLMHLAARDVAGLVSLWSTVGFAFLFVRYQQGVLTLPSFRRTARPAGTASAPPPRAAAKAAELDALLDKIARAGLHSLTPGERVRLEQLSQEANRRRGQR
ncbi:rhomboid family intramembrane serine protease [Oleiharenicola sp. Vm1]|uniref:rhomboid family intramembrane serine protease n=1 Tax=Oleiharenicola sp. Vm1 TaxID=3398393 RepID=UPI0039F4E514